MWGARWRRWQDGSSEGQWNEGRTPDWAVGGAVGETCERGWATGAWVKKRGQASVAALARAARRVHPAPDHDRWRREQQRWLPAPTAPGLRAGQLLPLGTPHNGQNRDTRDLSRVIASPHCLIWSQPSWMLRLVAAIKSLPLRPTRTINPLHPLSLPNHLLPAPAQRPPPPFVSVAHIAPITLPHTPHSV